MPAWPTIPDIQQDPQTHYTPLRAMKELLEIITGQRKTATAPMVRLFVQSLDPVKDPTVIALKGKVLQQGDLWIDTNNGNKIKFWDAQSQSWGTTS